MPAPGEPSRRALPSTFASLRAAFLCGLVAVLTSPTPAQAVRAKVGPDPYTKGDESALQKAGYVSLGPFPFGNNHTTDTIAELLGTEPLVWIETAHFRLGCALSPLELKGRDDWAREWIETTRDELKVLSQRLPGIKKRHNELDPWLRAHLMAHRLERLYAEVLQNLGVTDASFPATPDDPNEAATFRGLGPYLGMREKFTVLLLQKGSSHARYTRAHHGVEIEDPIRYHDAAFGCMYWGASQETANGLFFNDLALHAHLYFNVAHNLYTCYRAYGHDLPPWLATGLAHWHSRNVSPRFPTFDRKDDDDKSMRSAFWEWDKRVHGLLKNDAFEPLEKLVDRDNAGTFGLEQHMQAWAVVDFLMATRKAETFRFAHLMKEPFHGRRRTPTPEELAVRQRDALREALGVTPPELEQQWRGKVLGRRGR